MLDVFNQFSAWALLDIIFLAFIIYNILLLIRGTRAAQMLTGLIFILLAFILSNLLPLTTMRWVMSKFYSSFLIFLIIIFQDDIRLVLRRMGRRSFMMSNEQALSKGVFNQIANAAMGLAKKRVGALIVLERSIILNRYIDVGVSIDSEVSSELLHAIFHPTSPIHDGAVIIQGGRIAAAGCFLPLAREVTIDSLLGTRHRAGLGLSQETDAVVVMVSEEKGEVSLAVDGQMEKNLSQEELQDRLRQMMKRPSKQALPVKKRARKVGG